jgi:hypothetical protein
LLFALLGAAGLAGCGGGGSSTPAAGTPSGPGTVEVSAFRSSFCAARSSFGARLTADTAAVSQGVSGANGEAKARAVALGDVDALVRDFDTFAAALRAAGVPRVPGGDVAVVALNKTMADATATLQSARTSFVAARSKDAAAYAKAAAALRSAEQRAALTLQTGLAGVVADSPQLDAAIVC